MYSDEVVLSILVLFELLGKNGSQQCEILQVKN